MSNNSEYSESETNPKNQNDYFIYSLLRDKEYINLLYLIKKSITQKKFTA